MATIDLSTPVGRIRAATGDWQDPVVLRDEDIEAVYTNSSENENQAIKTCAYYILATLARNGHERLDRIEIWGSDTFNNYLKYVEKVITNPAGGLGVGGASIYAGGVDKEDFYNNLTDSTVINKRIPTYNNMRDPFCE